MAHNLMWAPCLVHTNVEKGGVVVGPGQAVGQLVDGIAAWCGIEDLCSLDVAYLEPVFLVAVGVGRERNKLVIIADSEIAEAEVLVITRFNVLVEHDHRIAIWLTRWATQVGCVLQSLS